MMFISANELLKYSAEKMNHVACEAKDHQHEEEVKIILDRISCAAHKGYFYCIISINYIKYESTIKILKGLGYKLDKVESSAEAFSWKISW